MARARKGILNVRITEAEKTALECMARRAGLTVTDYVCKTFDIRGGLAIVEATYDRIQMATKTYIKVKGMVWTQDHISYLEVHGNPELVETLGIPICRICAQYNCLTLQATGAEGWQHVTVHELGGMPACGMMDVCPTCASEGVPTAQPCKPSCRQTLDAISIRI